MAFKILETVLQKVTIVKPTVGTLLHGSQSKNTFEQFKVF